MCIRDSARAAEKSLRAAIASVTSEQVIEPVQAELDRYAAAVAAVAEARGRGTVPVDNARSPRVIHS